MSYKLAKYILVLYQVANDEWNMVCNSSLKEVEGITYYRYEITEEIGKFQKKLSRRFRDNKIDMKPVMEKCADISDSLQPQVEALKNGIKINLVRYVSPKWYDILSSVSTIFLLLNLADGVLKGVKYEVQFLRAKELIQELCDHMGVDYFKSGNIMENVSVQPINNRILKEISNW